MKQLTYLCAICILALSACTGSFKKSDDGMEYKIIKSGSGETVGYGNYIQTHRKQVYAGTKDSILMDTHDYMPNFEMFDSVNIPLSYYNILRQMRKGDSLIMRVLTDSAFKNQEKPMPEFMKKGKYMYLHLTMVNFFKTREETDSAYQAELALAKPRIFKKQIEEVEKDLAAKKPQLEKDSKTIEEYLAKNNIKAEKTKWGTYISITTEGTGNKLDRSNIASVNYTGRTLDSGRVFDSNIDPEYKHVQPLEVNIAELGSVIFGWTDALMHLKMGSKATIYVPSSLGYNTAGNGPKIGPDQNLVFDMEVIGVTTEEAYAAKQKAMQEEMMKNMPQEPQPNPNGETKPVKK